jgi:hypothetical protein
MFVNLHTYEVRSEGVFWESQEIKEWHGGAKIFPILIILLFFI